MNLSFARFVALLTICVAVIVGCTSLSSSGSGGGTPGGGPPGLPETPDDPSDTGFFAEDSHDVPGGTPGPVEEEEQTTEEGEETASHFRAIQVDPFFETSAGPKFVMPFDIDNDGMMDLITGWNQSQPVQIHLQRRDENDNVNFVAVTLGGTHPIGLIGDVDMADFNGDGWLDAAVLVKETGSVGVCPTDGSFDALDEAGTGEMQILFSPGNLDQITDGDAWREVRFARSQLPVRRDVPVNDAKTFPEFNGYTGLAVGEIDGINGPDVVVAYNPAKCAFYGDDPNPVNRIVLYANPGADNMFDPGQFPFSVTAVAGGPGDVSTNGAKVTLQGGESFSRTGLDGLGPAFGEVSYAWTQVAGPMVGLTGVTSAQPTFNAPGIPAALTFRLDVAAGGESDFDYVTVVVVDPALPPPNRPPTVVASGEQTVVPNAANPGSIVVQMSAVGIDPDGDALTYSWTQVAGEPVVLSGADTANTSFAAPAVGSELRFRVTVSDGTLLASDLVVINSGFWAPIVLHGDLPRCSDVKVNDVDLDGDNDVMFTYPDALSANIAWVRNPVDEVGAKDTLLAFNWELRPVGHLDTFADVFALGDVDGDGFQDVLARSADGLVVEWFRHPGASDLEPIFPPPDAVPDRFNFPWQVYTMAEYAIGRPAGLAVGDLTGDGLNEVAVAAGGVVYWYDGALVGSRYQRWAENFVVDDTKARGTTDDPTDPDFVDDGTVIYTLTIVDLDGDGSNDVIATFDRRVDSGVAEDTLIWFRNTLGDETGGVAVEP